MSTNFPASLDSLSNPTSGDAITGNATAALDLANQLANLNDAVEAIMAKVGANSSVVTTSLDYKINVTIPASIAAIASSKWTDSGAITYLTATTDDLVVGHTNTEWTSGTEYKLFYDQSKGAFRVGAALNADWNDASRGTGSAAFGVAGAKATGNSSFAVGGGYATGNYSFSGGSAGRSASGNNSFAFNSTSSGEEAFSFANASTASGDYSLAHGGGTASAEYSIALGNAGTASGRRSFVMNGIGAAASRWGQVARGGYSVGNSNAQVNEFVAARQTTNATPVVLLFDGGLNTSSAVTLTGVNTNVLTVPINNMHKFTVEVTARNTTTPGTFASWELKGTIVRSSSGDARFITTPTNVDTKDAGAALWDCAVSVNNGDATNNYLAITVTGAASTNISWMASIRTVQQAA